MFFLLNSSFASSFNFLVFIVSMFILPSDGSSSKANRCKKDDFPEPDGPTIATKSPSFIFILKFLNKVIEWPVWSKLFLGLLILKRFYSYLNALKVFIFEIFVAGK